MQKKPDKKVILLVVLMLVIAGIVTANIIGKDALNAEAEAAIAPQIAEVSGKLLEVNVEPGQSVKESDVIAVIDSEGQEYIVAQLEYNLAQTKLQGSSAVEKESNAISSAQSAYDSARLTARNAADDYAKYKALYAEGAISKSELNRAELALSQANKGLKAAEATLNDTKALYAGENAQLSVDKLQSQLEEAQKELDKYTIKASCDGTVITKNYTEGNFVSAGYNIAEISKVSETYLVAYVSEDRISSLKYGSPVTIKYDGKSYDGKISYIDVKKQYTPRDLQTQAGSDKKSFKIKIEPPDDCSILPGETAKVIVH